MGVCIFRKFRNRLIIKLYFYSIRYFRFKALRR